MEANNIHKKNRVYAPIIIGLCLFLFTFVVYPLYIEYVDTSIQVTNLENSKLEKQKKNAAIAKIQKEFNDNSTSDLKLKVQKYNHAFDTSYIMSEVMLNKFTKGTSLTPAQINIGSITINKGKKLPSGLSLANVSVDVSADTPDQIIDYITYLTTDSNYAFTIDNITLPLDTAIEPQDKKGLSLNLLLGVYYFE